MKRMISSFLIPVISLQFFCSQSLHAADDTFFDYQNYNHGYCPDCSYCPCRCQTGACNSNSCESAPPYPKTPPPCPPGTPCQAVAPCPSPCQAPCQTPCNPCDPAAPVCGSPCGISICAILVAIAAVVGAGAIIVASSSS